MNSIYIIQAKNVGILCATFEEDMAIKYIEEIKGIALIELTYRSVLFLKNPDTEINLIAGPIPDKYFPSSERTLMGDLKADAE